MLLSKEGEKKGETKHWLHFNPHRKDTVRSACVPKQEKPHVNAECMRSSHPNRPALLRCYINRPTSPLLLPGFLGPPNGRRLMSTRNSVPCFPLPPPDPPCPRKTLAQWAPSEGLNKPVAPYYPAPPAPPTHTAVWPETPSVPQDTLHLVALPGVPHLRLLLSTHMFVGRNLCFNS